MEIRIVIFLAFVSVTVITNTLLMWFAYKGFANFTSKVTETVSQFETSSETKEWIRALQSASEQAISATEATKINAAEVDAALDNARQRYRQTLANVDSKLETVADEITSNAQKVRDVVARPAFSVVAFAARLSQILESIDTEK